MEIIPIDSDEKYLCCLCILGLVLYDYMTPSAKLLYDTLTDEDKQRVKERIKNADN